MLSLVIPLYKSEPNLPRLMVELPKLRDRLSPEPLEVVFVVDGSPDRCREILERDLPAFPVPTQLVSLSRNFGSFNAIAAGLEAGRGERFAVLAADLQEPLELVEEFERLMRADEADVCYGVREGRSDPWLSELFSNAFWNLYSRLVIPEMPPKGVDIFGCNRMVRDRLLALPEINTNLIALLLWLGFRRKFVPYTRQARQEGKSAWTFRKKLRYTFASIFNFTDLPIQWLLFAGMVGSGLAVGLGLAVLWAWWRGQVPVPGYTPIVLTIMFFGGLTAFGLGIVGQYLWLALQNIRRRPNYIVERTRRFGGGDP
jgi:glycosyltransferase involved in cell wall biosynthesis